MSPTVPETVPDPLSVKSAQITAAKAGCIAPSAAPAARGARRLFLIQVPFRTVRTTSCIRSFATPSSDWGMPKIPDGFRQDARLL